MALFRKQSYANDSVGSIRWNRLKSLPEVHSNRHPNANCTPNKIIGTANPTAIA